MLIALTGWQVDAELNPGDDYFNAYFVKPADISKLLEVLGS